MNPKTWLDRFTRVLSDEKSLRTWKVQIMAGAHVVFVVWLDADSVMAACYFGLVMYADSTRTTKPIEGQNFAVTASLVDIV